MGDGLSIDRRSFLAGLGAALLGCRAGGGSRGGDASSTAAGGPPASAPPPAGASARPPALLAAPPFPPAETPFSLGVASGDPLEDRVVLWTRLAPRPDGAAGGLEGYGDLPLVCDMALDPDFDRLVASVPALAPAGAGHSVHVDLSGLAPATQYWYRFRVGPHTSPTGRTRTAPGADDRPESLTLAVASCQHYEHGSYVAHRHLAAEAGLDLVVFLGDYIYEGAASTGAFRSHEGPEPTDLAGYRRRYATYRTDPDLQAAHAAAPWIVTWDDHEVQNNYAGAHPAVGDPSAFEERRAAAYRAWWEHQPVRLPPPAGAHLPIHRSFPWGRLARLMVLDGRQYRSVQPCGDGFGPLCADVARPDATMLGPDQEAWLARELARSAAAGTGWAVLAQQTAMTDMVVRFAGREVALFDQWDGYPAARRRLLDAAADAGVGDLVVLTGDLHASVVGTVELDGRARATELIGPSIASRFPADAGALFELGLSLLPQISMVDTAHRGYLRCDVTPSRWTAAYRWVDDATDPASALRPASTWVVEAGRVGARRS